jgi:hypothetical protein
VNPVRAAEEGISTTTPADAASGAVSGAGIGLGIGALAALASLFIPGVGLVTGGGALAAALSAAGATTAAGAVAGGVTGYLKDQGMPDMATEHYGKAVEQGGAVIAVRLPSGKVERAEAEEVISKYQAANLNAFEVPLV